MEPKTPLLREFVETLQHELTKISGSTDQDDRALDRCDSLVGSIIRSLDNSTGIANGVTAKVQLPTRLVVDRPWRGYIEN